MGAIATALSGRFRGPGQWKFLPTSFFSTLRGRAIILAVLSALPCVAVMLSMAVQWRRHEVADASALALELVRRASAAHERELEATARTVAGIQSLSRRVPLQSGEIAALLEAALASGGPEQNAGAAGHAAQAPASAGGRPADGLAGRSFIAGAQATGLPTIDDYEIDLATRRASIGIAYPVREAPDQSPRVIVRVLDAWWLRDLGVGAGASAGALVVVFDSSGRVISRHPGVERASARGAAPEPLIDHALAVDGEGTIETVAFDGLPRAYAFGPLRGAATGRKQFIAVGIPTAMATALADRTLIVNFVGFSIAIVVVMLAASVAGDRLVVRHVRALVTVAERFGRGDWTARAGTPGRPPELAQLASTFDKMADALVTRQREIVRQRDRAAALEKRARAIVESIDVGVSLRDANGRWVYVSPATARILGRDPGEIMGRHARDFVHPEDVGLLEDMTESAGSGDSPTSTCFRVRHKDGSWRWVACDMLNLLDEPAVGALLTTCRDITAYRETQDELRQSRDELDRRVKERTAALVRANEALLSEIAERKRTQETLDKVSHALEQTADSVFVTDRDGVIEYVNPAFEAMTGYSRDEAVGQTPRLLASGRHEPKFFAALWSTLLSGRVFRSVVTNRAKDGRLFDEDQTITPMRDSDGTITHFVATGRDITERKRTEQAVRRLNHLLEQQTTRIAAVLHDEAGQFLTSAHIMLADLARDVPAPTRERLQAVRRHLDQVEEQIRDVSHDLHPRILTDLGLNGTLRFRAEAFSRRTGIKVTVQAARDYQLSATVQAALYRLVQEALTNVAKHAKASAVTVELSDDGDGVGCAVRDDGCGFDPARASDKRGDAGLGLQNMRDRIEALGGSLDVHSRPGQGTAIKAVVPAESE